MTSTSERPIALIVEDRPGTLANRKELFATHGFQAIGAKDLHEALREFRATPTVDVVVTDINLNESDEDDRSGVDLARLLKKRRPQMPIIAYSGHFDALEESEKEPFDDALIKANLTAAEFKGRLLTWMDQALEYRDRRAASAKSELDRMRSEGRLVEPDVAVLRDFLPGRSDPSLKDADDFQTPDEMLRREGWRFSLVEAGFRLFDQSFTTSVAVPFWIRTEAEITIAVLQGHSCIYHDDSNEERAISGALELMFGYYDEFRKDRNISLSPELYELRGYLRKVFE